MYKKEMDVFGVFGSESRKMVEDLEELMEEIVEDAHNLDLEVSPEEKLLSQVSRILPYFEEELQKEFFQLIEAGLAVSNEVSAESIQKMINSVGPRTIQMVLEFTNLFIRNGFVFTFEEIAGISAKYYCPAIRREIEEALADDSFDWELYNNSYQMNNVCQSKEATRTMLNELYDLFGLYLGKNNFVCSMS